MGPDDIREARERGGKPREDRPSEVDQYLDEVTGGYDGPTPEDVLQPTAYDALKAVCQSDYTSDVEDVAEVCGSTVQRVSKGMRLHGLSVSDGAERGPPDRFTFPLVGVVEPEHLRRPITADGRLLHALYVEAGMGVSEIATTLTAECERLAEDEIEEVTGADVRQGLIDVGLLDGERSIEKDAESQGLRRAHMDVRIG